MKIKGLNAFTIAEVLITLVVIGVVAALTIPNLIQKYNNKITETRLAKFYSTFNQAINLSTIENGPPATWDFTYREEDSEHNVINKSNESAKIFDKYLRPYMKITQRKEITNVEENNKLLLYYLPDGSAFAYSPHTNTDIHYFPNKPESCLKQTNTYGICHFLFIFAPANDDSRFTYVSKTGITPYVFGWDGDKNTLYKGGSQQYGCDISERGQYCTAIIAFNGWKIPKDYPRKIRY